MRTSRAVTGLVEKSLVSKEKSRSNARLVWVYLEPSGRALFEQMKSMLEELNQLLVQDLNATELELLTALLQKMTLRAQQLNASALITDKARRGSR